MPSSRDEYNGRLTDRRSVYAEQQKLSRRIGNFRLLAGLAAAALVYFIMGPAALSAWWLAAPVLAFAALVGLDARVARRLALSARAIAFYERGLARIDDRWMGGGAAGERFRDPSHVYSEDLDLFGKGSLFELLSTGRTAAGEETLARWLLAPAELAEALARQQAVEELRPALDLREHIALLGADIRAQVHPDVLAAWGEQPAVVFPRGSRIFAALLAAVSVLTFSAFMAQVSGLWAFLSIVLLQIAFAYLLRSRIQKILADIDLPARDLGLLSEILARLERERFSATRLVELRKALDTGGVPASRQIAKLRRLMELLDSRRNPAFAPLALLLLWSTQLSVAIEVWRQKSGPSIRRWLAAVGEIEALSALAAYAYEHPGFPFPEFTDGCGFEAEDLAHPLLPAGHCVPNDVRLNEAARVLIVSGSNMSGKSTLLRAVGLNTVLAWAGAPVRARRLRLSPLTVGCSIRVLDSLQDGRSRFYTEITRLRQIIDLTSGPRRVLFLLDELLTGTNSHDRRIGAEAVIVSLAERGAMGLVTTHDLALAHIADTPSAHAHNVHFEDRIENGIITFDYKMRPGIVQRSNALELMRSVGLDV